jgi:hypothetical protein
MTNLGKSIIVVCVAFAVVAFLVFQPTPKVGSIPIANDYVSTTTDSTFYVFPFYKVLKTGSGTFGSVVITNSMAGVLNVYDGTTTNHLDRATTTLAKFGASAAAGTYTFDTRFMLGLIIEG